MDLESIIHHLRGITSNPIWDDGVLVASPPDAVALVLAKYLPSEDGKVSELWNEPTVQGAQLGLFNPAQAEPAQEAKLKPWADSESSVMCPDCSGTLAYQEGCLTCHACGFNKCG